MRIEAKDVELLMKIVGTLYDWSGVTPDTDDEYDVLTDSAGMVSVTVGDLKDASTILSELKNLADT
jgi:hypothetical protein